MKNTENGNGEKLNHLLEERHLITKAFRRIRNFINNFYDEEMKFFKQSKRNLIFLKDGTFFSMGDKLLGDYYSFVLPKDFNDNARDLLKEISFKRELELLEPIDQEIMQFSNKDVIQYSRIDNLVWFNSEPRILEKHLQKLESIKEKANIFINSRSWTDIQKIKHGYTTFTLTSEGEIGDSYNKQQLVILGNKRNKDTLLKAVNEVLDAQIQLALDMINALSEEN